MKIPRRAVKSAPVIVRCARKDFTAQDLVRSRIGTGQDGQSCCCTSSPDRRLGVWPVGSVGAVGASVTVAIRRMRHAGVVRPKHQPAHASNEKSFEPRWRIGLIVGVSVALIFVISLIGWHVSLPPARSIWEAIFDVSGVLLLVFWTVGKFVSRRPILGELDWRYALFAATFLIGGFGLALTGGEPPSSWNRLIGVGIGIIGIVMCLAEVRQWLLWRRQGRDAEG
jgi:hypothetical protein